MESQTGSTSLPIQTEIGFMRPRWITPLVACIWSLWRLSQRQKSCWPYVIRRNGMTVWSTLFGPGVVENKIGPWGCLRMAVSVKSVHNVSTTPPCYQEWSEQTVRVPSNPSMHGWNGWNLRFHLKGSWSLMWRKVGNLCANSWMSLCLMNLFQMWMIRRRSTGTWRRSSIFATCVNFSEPYL